MNPTLDPAANEALEEAIRLARATGHRFAGTGHLFLALTDPGGCDLTVPGVDVPQLRDLVAVALRGEAAGTVNEDDHTRERVAQTNLPGRYHHRTGIRRVIARRVYGSSSDDGTPWLAMLMAKLWQRKLDAQ